MEGGRTAEERLAPPCGVAAARPSKTEVKRTSKLVAEAEGDWREIDARPEDIMTQYDAARFELLGGFERACALPASELLRTESMVDSCAGGCAQLCLAASASPRICLGFECRSHSGACLLFSAHPNGTSERAHSECWRRRISGEAGLLEEGIEAKDMATPVSVISGIAVSSSNMDACDGEGVARSLPITRWGMLPSRCRYTGLPQRKSHTRTRASQTPLTCTPHAARVCPTPCMRMATMRRVRCRSPLRARLQSTRRCSAP